MEMQKHRMCVVTNNDFLYNSRKVNHKTKDFIPFIKSINLIGRYYNHTWAKGVLGRVYPPPNAKIFGLPPPLIPHFWKKQANFGEAVFPA